jgi:hypothetical protein
MHAWQECYPDDGHRLAGLPDLVAAPPTFFLPEANELTEATQSFNFFNNDPVQLSGTLGVSCCYQLFRRPLLEAASTTLSGPQNLN